MKIYCCLSFLLITVHSFSQLKTSELNHYIKNGVVVELRNFLDVYVSTKTLQGDEEELSSSNAVEKIRYFFRKHPPQDFHVQNETLNNSSGYDVNRLLTTKDGLTYRLRYSTRPKGDHQIITSWGVEVN